MTEFGTVYSLDEMRAIADVTHRHGLKLHVDGARFANAVASQNCSLAEMSWKAGVDVLSFGATKNGAIAAEAVVFFDKALMRGAAELASAQACSGRSTGSLPSNGRPIFADGLWLRLARASERASSAPRRGPPLKWPVAKLAHPADANEVFVQLPEAVIDRLEADGFKFYRRGGGVIRLVTSYETSEAEVEQFVFGRQNPRRLSLFFRP